MLPVLYSSSSSEFASNGLGVLVDCLKCEVTEERNGIFEMVFTYPASGQHADLIVPDAIVKATAHYGDKGQLFRIYEITKTIDGNYEVYCQHISYQLSFIPCTPFDAKNVQEAMSMIKSHMIADDRFARMFNFYTDKTTVANLSVSAPISTRSLLGGVEGSVLDTYRGEYEFDNFDVKFWAHRGENRGVVLRYGKNISDISQEVNIENVYTHLFPFYATEQDYVEIPETYLACSNADQFPFKRIMILDCTSEFQLVDEQTGEDRAPTPQELLEYAQAYMKNRDFGKFDASIDIDFESLQNYEEYYELRDLETVGLCDTVTVYYPSLNISTSTKVIKTVWNTLLNKYISLELGAVRSNFSSTVAASISSATSAASENSITSYSELTSKPQINGKTLEGNVTTRDLGISYEETTNKPSINGVALIGNKTSEELRIDTSAISLVHIDSTANWNVQRDLVGQAGHLYVYKDYEIINDVPVPAFKIGDGSAYLIDTPFVDGNMTTLTRHINDTDVHITPEERAFWNDKVTCFLSQGNMNTLVFSKEREVE